MALVLDIVKSDIHTETIEKWLLGHLPDLGTIPLLLASADHILFPVLLRDYIKEATKSYIRQVSSTISKLPQQKKKHTKFQQPGRPIYSSISTEKSGLSPYETNKFIPHAYHSNGQHPRNKTTYQAGPRLPPSGLQLKDFMPANFNSNKAKQKASLVTFPSGEPTPNFQDTDEFPSIGAARKKRINPTLLTCSTRIRNVTEEFSAPTKTVPVSTPFREAQEKESHHTLEDERALLRKERKKNPTPSLAPTFPIPLSIPDEFADKADLFSDPTPIKPDIQLVTGTCYLRRLAQLFAYCLHHNLLPHWYSELQHLVELLTTTVSSSSPHDTLFSNTHQVCYFAACALQQLADDLTCLDSASVRFLAENSRLKNFAPQLVDKLVRHLAASQEPEENRPQTLPPPSSIHTHVSFQSDTDNRSNFPSEEGFRAFRKQRDAFYSVWREWEDNHLNPEWSMLETQGHRITYLLNLCPDPINLFHLARLFQAQLIATCGGQAAMTTASQMQSKGKVPVNEDDPFLLSLKESNPAKYRRLQERLINPSTSQDAHISGVYFPGHQPFFQQFLLATDRVSFREQLQNLLITTIQKMDEQSGVHEWTETDNYIINDVTRRQALTAELLSLRLLAKFLGFLTFLPYQTHDILPDNVVQAQLALREHIQPPFDIAQRIKKAMEKQQLLITLPWVVMFLAMTDAVSLRLPPYQALLAVLDGLYRHQLKPPYLPANNAFFLKLVVSWLFEQPCVALPKYETVVWTLPKAYVVSFQASLASLDQRWLIDSALLYQCCPYLYSVKTTLKDGRWREAGTIMGSSNAVSGTTARKITPIAAHDLGKSTHLLASIQTRLEENFFYGQPSTVRRTVDMVAERLAANIIKQTRMQIIPNLLQATVSKLTQEDESQSCVKLCEVVGKEMESLISSYGSASDAALSALLPCDTSPAVLRACQAITHRFCKDKCHQWLTSEIKPAWFEGELNSSLVKVKMGKDSKTTNSAADCSHSEIHNEDNAPSPTLLLIRLRDCVRGIIQGETIPTEKEVLELLADVTPSLSQRLELLPLVERQIYNLTFELLTTLICFLPDLTSNALVDQFVATWVPNLPNASSSSFTRTCATYIVFSPRQMLLLSQSPEARLTWSRWTHLVISLVKTQLLTPAELETQSLGVIRQEWPSPLLRRLATCLQDFVDWQNATRATAAQPNGGPECVQLIDWLAWFCMEVDNP